VQYINSSITFPFGTNAIALRCLCAGVWMLVAIFKVVHVVSSVEERRRSTSVVGYTDGVIHRITFINETRPADVLLHWRLATTTQTATSHSLSSDGAWCYHSPWLVAAEHEPHLSRPLDARIAGPRRSNHILLVGFGVRTRFATGLRYQIRRSLGDLARQCPSVVSECGFN